MRFEYRRRQLITSNGYIQLAQPKQNKMAARASGSDFRRRVNEESFTTLNLDDVDSVGSDIEDEVEEESEDEREINNENSDPNARVARENPKAKKKGRKGTWNEKQVGDMIDVICENETFQKKLIYTNIGKNTDVYRQVQAEVWQRHEAEELDVALSFPFSPEQMRTKFKRCVGDCKKAALLRKTASGIAALQEEKQYGPWFNRLFPLVKSRDSCQPERAKEPSASLRRSIKSSVPSTSTDVSTEESTSAAQSQGSEKDMPDCKKELFTPRKRKRASKKVDDQLEKAMQMMQRVVESDETDKLIKFMQEENRKAREHELMLLQMIMSISSPQPLYQPHFSPVPVTNIQNPAMSPATFTFRNSSTTIPTNGTVTMGQGVHPDPGQFTSLLSDPNCTFTQFENN